jgi:malate dehydrogenase
MLKQINVAVTGAAGQIGYSLLPRLIDGNLFGKDTAVNLSLIEIPQALERLKGTVMELTDCSFSNLGSVTQTADLDVGFKDADVVLLVGSVPRKEGMDRRDLLKINGGIFREQGAAIGRVASDYAKILVVGNPANTNALIGSSNDQNKTHEWQAMTMLDVNRTTAQLAKYIDMPVSAVKNVVIWGNHSSTMTPDVFLSNVDIHPERDGDWVANSLFPTVQNRGAAIIEARGFSSALSAANAIVDTVSRTLDNHPNDYIENNFGQRWSTAILSKGEYGAPEGVFFGFPVFTGGLGIDKRIRVVLSLDLDPVIKDLITVTGNELLAERALVEDLLP